MKRGQLIFAVIACGLLAALLSGTFSPWHPPPPSRCPALGASRNSTHKLAGRVGGTEHQRTVSFTATRQPSGRVDRICNEDF